MNKEQIKKMSTEEVHEQIVKMLERNRDEILELCVKTAMNPLIGDDFIGAETNFADYGPLGQLIDVLTEGAANFRIKIEYLGGLTGVQLASQKLAAMTLLVHTLRDFTGLLGAFAEGRETMTGEKTEALFAKLQAAENLARPETVN